MKAETILNYLLMVSNKNVYLNLIMHIIAIIAVLSVFMVKNETKRSIVVNISIVILLMSIVANAITYGNPFHLVTILILAVMPIINLFSRKRNNSNINSTANIVISIATILLGLWYPEFVNADKFQLLLISPLGAVPCPTLLTILGIISLSASSVNKLQYVSTVIMGIIYGIIGTFILKVPYDITLLIAFAYGLFNIYRLRKYNKNLSSTSDIKIEIE